MPSPFPGMDPYLEISGDWRDFHSRFLTVCADALAEQLPENYIVRIEERFQVLEYPQETIENRYPDVSVARIRPTRSAEMPLIPIATLEPEVIPLVTTIVEDAKERWIEIRRKPDWEAVTIIELLSPANKRGYGYEDYLYKRVSLIARTIHLVELDFLIGGQSLPMGRPLRGDYHVLVSRAEQRPLSNVYSWSIRAALPVIPIPLMAPDPDVALDLRAIFATVYQRGQYQRSIDYTSPLVLPLSPEDRTWAESLAQAFHSGTAQ
jgi:Protein of unknown function (DUF4058)